MMLFIEALVAMIEKTMYPSPKCDSGDSRCRPTKPRRF